MEKIKNADGIGRAGNLVCGDVMTLYLKIKKDKIVDIKLQTFGCAVAMANTSLLTTMVKGKSLEEALKITKDDILKKLEKVSPIKVHCSILALDALHEAVYDSYKRNKLPIPPRLQKEHERIQQTIKTIEARDREFMKLEEKALK